jgi:hypothetical protein
MNKRSLDKPEHCCFCSEKESIVHLFFECVVSKVIWGFVKELLGLNIGSDISQLHLSGCMKKVSWCKYHLNCGIERNIADKE